MIFVVPQLIVRAGTYGIIVTSNADDTLGNLATNGECDLREAIAAANAYTTVGDCVPSVLVGPILGAPDDDFEITFNSYQTQVEVIQSGLAPFGQIASRLAKRADETTITREFRRDYTIRVATQFKPQSFGHH